MPNIDNKNSSTNLSVLTVIKDLEVQDATFFGYPHLVMDKAVGSYISDIEATDTDSRQTGRRIRERRICPEKDG